MKPNRFFAEKPTNAKVEITHQADSLSVYIPPAGFHPFMIVPAIILWSGAACVKTALRVPTIANTPFILFAVLYLLMGLVLLYPCLCSCYCKTYLQIDRQIVSYDRLLLGLQIGKQKLIPIPELRHVSLIRRTWKGRKPRSEVRLKGHQQQIILSFGGIGGGTNDDSADERVVNWMAYELKEWLDLPLRFG